MNEFCKEFLSLRSGLWVEEFPNAKNRDFTFSYVGDDSKEEVTVHYKSKKVDCNFISPLPASWDNGSWKITLVPSP